MSSLFTIDPISTTNKWFLIHTGEWKLRWHIGMDQVSCRIDSQHVFLSQKFVSPFSFHLVMSSPAWPICNFWCLKRCLRHFLQYIFEMDLFCPKLIPVQSRLDESQSVSPFLILDIKLSSIKDDNVGNLRKFEYLYNCLRHSCFR